MITCRILLVDDDERAMQTIAALLTRAGASVVAVGGGVEACARLAAEPFDVVLSDIWMPDLDGIAVLQAARELPDPPEVVLMTGNSSVETAVAALRSGAFNYLFKPCDPDELLATVQAAARRRDEHRRRAALLHRIAADLAAVVGPATRPAPEPVAPPPQPAPRAVRLGPLELSPARREASYAGSPLALTPTEFALLERLAQTPGAVCAWADLAAATHHLALGPDEAHELLRPHVRNLRRKLDPRHLVTVRGLGVMLDLPE